MSFPPPFIRLSHVLAMPPYSPSSSSGDSRDTSPMPMSFGSLNTNGAKNKVQTSPFLKLPVDIFKCVLDYLDRDAAWALKRLCRGMSKSEVVDELLYRYPIQLDDVRDIRLGDWKYRTMGQARWISFKVSSGAGADGVLKAFRMGYTNSRPSRSRSG